MAPPVPPLIRLDRLKKLFRLVTFRKKLGSPTEPVLQKRETNIAVLFKDLFL